MGRGRRMNFGVCIVGCGDMGRVHASGWQMRDDARVISVCDVLEDRRQALAEKTGAVAFEDYREAVRTEGVNVVSVCVPVHLHSEVTCFAAEHGCHVLCEKPLALTVEEADAAIACARKNGVLLSTSFQCRGFARHQKTKQLFAEGAFGGPIFARFTDIREVRPKVAMHRRSMNGGPIIDMAGHFFDLMRFITGCEPLSVYAQGHVFGRGKERLTGIEDLALDAADIEVRMTGGHVMNVFVNWGMPEGYPGLADELFVGPELSIHTSNGRVEIVSRNGKEEFGANEGNPPGSSVRINDLANAILEGRQPEVTGEDGRTALAVSLAAIRSIETGKVVEIVAESGGTETQPINAV